MSNELASSETTAGSRSEVVEKLTHARWTVVWQRALTHAIWLAALLFIFLSTVTLLDYFLVLSTGLRAAAGVCALAAIIGVGIRLTRQRNGYDEQDVAAEVEDQFPEYGQRLRTSLDYSEPDVKTAPASPEMVAALHVDTQKRTQFSEFTEVTRTWPLVRAALSIVVLLGIGVASLIRQPELLTSLGRTFLIPLHYSELSIADVDGPVAAGRDVTIEAQITGRPLADVKLNYRAKGADEWQTISLGAVDSDGRIAASEDGKTAEDTTSVAFAGMVAATLQNLQDDVEVFVSGGELATDRFIIDVLKPLTLKKAVTHVEPPAYTGQTAESVESRDVRIIEGTNLAFEFEMNREPSTALLVPVSTGSPSAAEKAGEKETIKLAVSGSTMKADFDDVRSSMQFVLAAKTADGMEYESERFRVRVTPDGKPTIRFVDPPEDHEVTPTTEVALAVEADDDFGISKVGVACKVAEGEMQTLWEESFDLGTFPKDADGRPLLLLEDFDVTFQDAVTYYAFVEDSRPGDAGRTMTELKFVDIRPYKREFQILKQGGT